MPLGRAKGDDHERLELEKVVFCWVARHHRPHGRGWAEPVLAQPALEHGVSRALGCLDGVGLDRLCVAHLAVLRCYRDAFPFFGREDLPAALQQGADVRADQRD